MGLVKGDSHSMPALPSYGEIEEEDDDPYTDDKHLRYGRGITTSPPRRGSDEKDVAEVEVVESDTQRNAYNGSRSGSQDHSDRQTPPPPPPTTRKHSPPRGGDGAFI